MKTNEAPERIYVEIRHPFGNEFTEMLGFEHRGNSDDIEYVRLDVFIDKASTWFANRYQVNGSYLCANDIEDFVKYMKGE